MNIILWVRIHGKSALAYIKGRLSILSNNDTVLSSYHVSIEQEELHNGHFMVVICAQYFIHKFDLLHIWFIVDVLLLVNLQYITWVIITWHRYHDRVIKVTK